MTRARAGRALALLGAVWGAVAAAYLAASAFDVNTTPSLMQNASARRADLAFPVAALVLALVTAIVVGRHRTIGAVGGVVVAVVGLGYFALGAEAVSSSDREALLPTLLLVVAPPALAMVAGGWLLCAAHSPAALVGSMAVVVGLAGVAAATVFVEEADEAVVASGIHDDWDQETAVDNVFVDEVGNVWGVRPWDQAEPAIIFLLDPESGEFRETAERRPGWPPTVLGADATGATWIVTSEIDDPFQPVFETYSAGHFAAVPAPASPLPPLDAVVLDGRRNRVVAMHSNFAVPAGQVLEVFEGGRWRTEATPIVAGSRASALDVAVDPAGMVLVWHDADPGRVHRYDGRAWTPLPLPFDLETTTDLDFPPLSMDAHRTFFPDPDRRVWLYDHDGHQLVVVTDEGAVADRRPLPEECVPVTFDPDARVWCADGDGLKIVAPDGAVLYDSQDDGVHGFETQSVAIGPERAWVLARRERGGQLLTFDYRTALARD